jgi:hypothetical protein
MFSKIHVLRFFITVFLFAIILTGYSQPKWNWVSRFGSTGADIVTKASMDNDGYLYYTGYFTNTITFGTIQLNAAGGTTDQDMFVAVFDQSGNVKWAQRFGGNGNDIGNKIAVDNVGNIYVAGNYASTNIPSFAGPTPTPTNAGGSDAYVLKYNYTGSHSSNTWTYSPAWITYWGNANSDYANGLTVDKTTGDCYVTGGFTGTVNFATGYQRISQVNGSTSTADIYTAKLSSANGSIQWVSAGGSQAGDDGTYDMALDNSGNVYSYGFIRGISTFSPVSNGSITTGFGGLIDVCLVQYRTSDGYANWAKQYGSGNSDIGIGIAVTPNGHVNITGYFQGTVSFGTGGLQGISNGGSNDIFVLQLNTAGTELWLQTATAPGDERGQVVAVDASNNIYVGGLYTSGSITFGTVSLALGNSGGYDGFLARYGDNGSFHYAMKAGDGGTATDQVTAILADNTGNVFVAGDFENTNTFSPTVSGGTPLSIVSSSSNIYDIFISKVNGNTYTWIGPSGGSTSWNNSTNWSPNGVPGIADNVIIQTGVTYNPVLINAVSVFNFTINSGIVDLATFGLTITSNATCNSGTINNGPLSIIGGTSTFAGTTLGANVTSNTLDLYLNGSTFNGTLNVTKSGGVSNTCTGNNTFTKSTTITNASALPLYLGGDTYTSTASTSFFNTGTGGLYPSNTGTSTYGNSINVRCTNAAAAGNGLPINGIMFGNSGGISSVTNGGIGISASYSNGILDLKNVQVEYTGTPPVLALTGSAVLKFSPGTYFKGPLTSVNAPLVYLNGATFYQSFSVTQTGSFSTVSSGGNTFNVTSGGTTISNSGSADMTLANVSGDTFTNGAIFNKNGTGNIYPAYNNSNYFKGDITTNAAMTFGAGNGTVIMNHPSNIQTIYPTSGIPTFNRLQIDKPVNVSIMGSFIIGINLTFTPTASSTLMNSSSVIVTFNDNATVTGDGGLNFFAGRVTKIGDEGFKFPVGKGSVYRPIQISGPGNVAAQITAEYYNTGQTLSSTLGTGLLDLTTCEYWYLGFNGFYPVQSTLFWNNITCSQINKSVMCVASYNAGNSTWSNAGTIQTGDNINGTVQSSSTSTANYLTLGYLSLLNLNTAQVNASTFTVTGADNYHTTNPYPFTSGPGSSVIKIHPSASSTVNLSIAGSTSIDPLTIPLGISSTYQVASVQAPFENNTNANVASTYYTYTSNTLTFLKQSTPPSEINITTNLTNGIIYDRNNPPNNAFTITVPSPGFTGYTLRIIDKAGTLISSTAFAASPITWTASAGQAAGAYKFELVVTVGATNYSYFGQFILK